MESRKDELIAKIRERRSRLEQTMSTLDDRIAAIGEVKEKAVKIGRTAVLVIAVTTVTIVSLVVLKALMPRPRRVVPRRRWLR